MQKLTVVHSGNSWPLRGRQSHAREIVPKIANDRLTLSQTNAGCDASTDALVEDHLECCSLQGGTETSGDAKAQFIEGTITFRYFQ